MQTLALQRTKVFRIGISSTILACLYSKWKTMCVHFKLYAFRPLYRKGKLDFMLKMIIWFKV